MVQGNAMAMAIVLAAWLRMVAHNGNPTPADLAKHVQTDSVFQPVPTNAILTTRSARQTAATASAKNPARTPALCGKTKPVLLVRNARTVNASQPAATNATTATINAPGLREEPAATATTANARLGVTIRIATAAAFPAATVIAILPAAKQSPTAAKTAVPISLLSISTRRLPPYAAKA